MLYFLDVFFILNGLCPDSRRYFNTNCFLNTVITLAPVLTNNLKRTVESNTNDLKKNSIITLSQNVLLVCIC